LHVRLIESAGEHPRDERVEAQESRSLRRDVQEDEAIHDGELALVGERR
jgi:hypothetical protein